MENIEGLTPEEIKELILESLRELSVDTETIEINVLEGNKIVLKGKVDSDSERGMIKETIMDIVGIEDIIDEMVVIVGLNGELEDDETSQGDDLYDEDEESMGTEDAFQSVEDGIPYIPPSSPTYQESHKVAEWKKKKKRSKNTR